MFYTSEQQRPKTLSNIMYLILSFPLGLFYFLVIVIGLSVGISTLIIWIGLPILFATLYASRGLGQVEQKMAAYLLGRPFSLQSQEGQQTRLSFLQQFGRLMRDPYTWTSLFYMIIKFPLGIICFVFALVLPIVSISLAALPVVYLINLYINTILVHNGIDSASYIIPYFIEIHGGQFDGAMFARTFLIVPIGVGLWFISRWFLNSLATFSQEMAIVLLGPTNVVQQTSPAITGGSGNQSEITNDSGQVLPVSSSQLGESQ
jgi:Putative sensor